MLRSLLVLALVATFQAAANAAAGTEVAARPCRPLLVATVLDKSGSATGATPEATEADIARLAVAVASCGGELAIGTICDTAEPLRRLFLEPPINEPEPAALSANPYERQRELAARAKEQRRWAAAASERTARVAGRINAFIAETRAVLARANACKRSDVAGAVNRGLLFLGEDTGAPPLSPRKVLLIVSDGRHNVGPWNVHMPADIDVRLVNFTGNRGALALPRIRIFEALTAAMRDLHID